MLVAATLAGCNNRDADHQADALGDASHGVELIRLKGCGSCHIIPGVKGAKGLVGPPLNKIGKRIFLAGVLRNSPDNMVAWLMNPQAVVPGNAMPDTGLTDKQAHDIAAYLETLN